jgi:hypothetical protein
MAMMKNLRLIDLRDEFEKSDTLSLHLLFRLFRVEKVMGAS